MSEAKYLYCLTNRLGKSYGNIGIDDNKVYAVVYKDIAAIVHDCESQPYESKNVEKVKNWILFHNNVIETVIGNKWVVIPFRFDTIIRGEGVLENWLTSIYPQVKREFERLFGRLEYSVDIYLKPITKTLDLEKIKSGKEYLLKKRSEILALEKLNFEMAEYRSGIKEKIREMVTDIKAVKPRNIPEGFEDKMLVAAFSCLATQEELKNLGKLLSEINKKFAVRFTGPWPPYSFVDTLEAEEGLKHGAV